MAASNRLPMARGFGRTERMDGWWSGPLVTALFLGACIVYGTWRGFMEADFWIFENYGLSSGNYGDSGTMAIESEGSHVLSPLYSPLIIPGADGLGSWVPKAFYWMSPAMFILIIPAGFRGTCYYYRKAYYRSFFANPVGCAVSTPFNEYHGERRLFLFQNLHRYFMYAAVAYLFVLSYDVLMSMRYHDVSGSSFGISVGTLVLALNLYLLAGYTFGCHSFRHAIGGIRNRFGGGTAGKLHKAAIDGCTHLNKRHMNFAWLSLFWVMFSDFYVWMCTEGIWTNIVLFGGL